jgi:hypothetical protein
MRHYWMTWKQMKYLIFMSDPHRSSHAPFVT